MYWFLYNDLNYVASDSFGYLFLLSFHLKILAFLWKRNLKGHLPPEEAFVVVHACWPGMSLSLLPLKGH